jgi:hypothetical protein
MIETQNSKLKTQNNQENKDSELQIEGLNIQILGLFWI